MQFAQIRDLIKSESQAACDIDASGLTGEWVNSNPDTNGIARMVVTRTEESLSLQVYAIGPDGLIDWGEAQIDVFAASATSRIAAGFTCAYDFGFAETKLQAMILKGLIVLAQLNRFKDGSNRVDYFVREYFALDHGRY